MSASPAPNAGWRPINSKPDERVPPWPFVGVSNELSPREIGFVLHIVCFTAADDVLARPAHVCADYKLAWEELNRAADRTKPMPRTQSKPSL